MEELSYYEILEIEKDADLDAIRKAYKKMALKWHPDKNPSQEAEENFKKITEAYSVLGDPEKKKVYDVYGKTGLEEHGFPVDIDEILSQMGLFNKRTPTTQIYENVSLEEIYSG